MSQISFFVYGTAAFKSSYLYIAQIVFPFVFSIKPSNKRTYRKKEHHTDAPFYTAFNFYFVLHFLLRARTD